MREVLPWSYYALLAGRPASDTEMDSAYDVGKDAYLAAVSVSKYSASGVLEIQPTFLMPSAACCNDTSFSGATTGILPLRAAQEKCIEGEMMFRGIKARGVMVSSWTRREVSLVPRADA